MSQIQKLPYRTPSEKSISFGTWMTDLEYGAQKPLNDIIPSWDPATKLRASIDVTINYKKIKQECGFKSDINLRLASFWFSEGTLLKGCSDYKDVNFKNNQEEYKLYIDLEGKNLSKRVKIWVELLLLEVPKENKMPFTAKIIGSVLAKSIPYQVILEGEGPRFPIEIIDFRDTNYPSDAGWFLQWDANDLNKQILSDVRLFINSSHERIKVAVTSESDEYFDIRETIKYDIARILLIGALENEEFIADPDQYSDGSVGAAVRTMLNLYYPQIQITHIRENSKRLEFFDAVLQEKLKIFQKE